MITGAEVSQFSQNGFIVVENLLSQHEVDDALKCLDDLIARVVTDRSHIYIEREAEVLPKSDSPNAEPPIRKLADLADNDDTFRGITEDTRIRRIVHALIGARPLKHVDQMFMKPAEVGSRKEYHQDSQSWRRLVPYNLVACWIALDDATAENGCLRVIPGSHRLGLLGRSGQVRIEHQALSGCLSDEVEIPVQPGDAIFHHSLLLHCSGSNRTSQPRRAYSVHYQSARSINLPRVRVAGPVGDWIGRTAAWLMKRRQA